MTQQTDEYRASLKVIRELKRAEGQGLALGFLDIIGTIIILSLLLSLVAQAIMPTDDSDTGRFNRSGFNVRVDQATGCQYLVSANGQVIPRGDGNGFQNGCRR